ncbi:radical SAM protein [Candidatus Woesearchaeota archaeon]|nr:radical SAM protein [Candidatus Woesearchaeota archaeon]
MELLSKSARLEFGDLEFEERDGLLRVFFYRNFFFDVDRGALESIGELAVGRNFLEFGGVHEARARSLFNAVLDRGFASLRHRVTKKPAFYIHRYSGIPLIGSNAFGLVDRNTNIIEVKPLSGCNENCIYCSVDEGLSTSKVADVVVERSYLVDEFRKLAEFKGCETEAYINSQGEPTLYGPLPALIRDLRAVDNVRGVVMNSNGSVLDEEYIDRLAAAGLKRLNLSLNALDERKAKVLAGWGLYDINRIRKVAEYAAARFELLIAPVWVPGFNDEEIPKLVRFALDIGARIGIQNYLFYRKGRNPVKQASWERFYAMLSSLEKEFGVNLTKMELKDEFRIHPTKNLPKPFRKGQVADAEVKCPGRYPDEKVCVSGGRNITVTGCARDRGVVKVRITRTKHNVFDAVAL